MQNKRYQKIAFITIIGFSFLTWLVYYVFGGQLISEMYYGHSINIFNVPRELSAGKAVSSFLDLTRWFIFLIIFLCISAISIWCFKDTLSNSFRYIFKINTDEEIKGIVINMAILVGCSWACFYCLLNQGFQGDWYLIKELMIFKGYSPFQQRILFLLLAKAVLWTSPSLTYIQAYCLSQLLPIILGFYFIRKWAELFVPNTFSFVAPLILLAMVIPTISYYTFYDFGIILFFTICLYLIFKRKYLLYYIVFAVGIFNHEIILFMSFLFLYIHLKDNSFKNNIWIAFLIQLAIFLAVRAVQYAMLPADNITAQGRVWINLNYIFHKPLMLSNTIIMLSVWCILSFIGIKHAPKKLRRCCILFPLLMLSTLFVGQFNELRQFDAFIPVALALIMCFLQSLQQNNNITTQ